MCTKITGEKYDLPNNFFKVSLRSRQEERTMSFKMREWSTEKILQINPTSIFTTSLSIWMALCLWNEAKSYQIRFWTCFFFFLRKIYHLNFHLLLWGSQTNLRKSRSVISWKLFSLIDKTISWPKRVPIIYLKCKYYI